MKKYLTLLIILFLSSNLINAQWYNQSSGVYENLYETFFIDQNTGWIIGANGRILKTTNSGVSWIPKSSGTNYALTFIKFLTPIMELLQVMVVLLKNLQMVEIRGMMFQVECILEFKKVFSLIRMWVG
ncbi:MAG: hypothetical protein M5T52_21515 [Ignavibacteriaceae bacterium]|nr:hypothetical protein [Ignavibacteriaceae bacterium]